MLSTPYAVAVAGILLKGDSHLYRAKMSANLNTNSSTQSMNAMEHFLSEKFKARVASLMVEHNVPGLAIALVHHKRIESQAFGLACIDPPLPCTSDTLFNIASASKSMTAASVAMLVEDEAHPEVQWEAIMSHILPGDFLMSQDSYTNEVTLDDVVSHRTGLPRSVPWFFEALLQLHRQCHSNMPTI